VTRASKELARVRAGTLTFDALVKLWSTRKFDPCPHATTPDEAWQMDEDGEFGGGPGTWDETVSFMCLGLLTPDEYAQISAPCVSACAYHFTRENVMPRKRSLTSDLYWAARTSNNVRAASRGPGAYAKRVVRRKTYSKSLGATGRLLRIFGLGK
jgi:hypothetical protein